MESGILVKVIHPYKPLATGSVDRSTG